MPTWKKTIFINAIKVLMRDENKTAEEVIVRYTKLTDAEKTEILAAIAS